MTAPLNLPNPGPTDRDGPLGPWEIQEPGEEIFDNIRGS
jgi:hypothetical protein